MTAPPSVDVTLFQQTDPYRNLRDELTVARVDFIEAAKSPEARTRTVTALGLTDADADYTLDVRQVRDSDFIDLSVQARTPELAQRTANAHAEAAIAYAAELRSMPAKASLALLTDRLRSAQADLESVQRDATSPTDPALKAAQDNYQLVQRKLAEAQLKATSTYSAQAMQIVSRAQAPLSADTRKVQMLLVLGALSGLVAGIVLSFTFDALAMRLETALTRLVLERAAGRSLRGA